MEITHRHAALCGSLADYHRILMLYALSEHPYNVSELAGKLGLSQPTVSRHLKILRDCGAVSGHRRGKSMYYLPADPRILQALDLLRAVLTDQMIHQGKAADSAAHRPAI